MDWKWRRLEKDWRWTDCGLEVDSMDEIGTGGGLHEDPWGSVRYRALVALICAWDEVLGGFSVRALEGQWLAWLCSVPLEVFLPILAVSLSLCSCCCPWVVVVAKSKTCLNTNL